MYPRQIYAIQHNVTKRIYIGCSKNVSSRFRSHMASLRSGRHGVEDMQEDFDKFGEDFSVFILDRIDSSETREKEYEWMKEYESYVRGIGYNYKDKGYFKYANATPVPYKDGLPEKKTL